MNCLIKPSQYGYNVFQKHNEELVLLASFKTKKECLDLVNMLTKKGVK